MNIHQIDDSIAKLRQVAENAHSLRNRMQYDLQSNGQFFESLELSLQLAGQIGLNLPQEKTLAQLLEQLRRGSPQQRKDAMLSMSKCLLELAWEIESSRINYAQQELTRSFSQGFEDLYLDFVLQAKPVGFYVDIGANHPSVISNTKRFYDRGWRGINVEPQTHMFRLFEEQRPYDINLNIGIGGQAGSFPFYVCSASVLSSFIKEDVETSIREHKQLYNLDFTYQTIEISVERLDSVLLRHVPEGKAIDFMSVDVEGLELEVLGSNDWKRFRPQWIILETNRNGQELIAYMNGIGYSLNVKTELNGIFSDEQAQ